MFYTFLMPSAERLRKRMVCLSNSINVGIYLTTNPDTTSRLRRSPPRQWSKASSRQPLTSTSLKFLFLFLFRKTHSPFFHSENSTMILFFSLGVADETTLTGLDLHLHGNFFNQFTYLYLVSWLRISGSTISTHLVINSGSAISIHSRLEYCLFLENGFSNVVICFPKTFFVVFEFVAKVPSSLKFC